MSHVIHVPEKGTIAKKQENTVIETSNGKEIKYNDRVKFEQFGGQKFYVSNFLDVGCEDAKTFIHFYSCNNVEYSDTGISGFDIDWEEVAERVDEGKAKIC